MTHEELLAKISLGEQFEGATWRIDIDSIVKQLIALREVVKLHKPMEDSPYCEQCCLSGFEYPCHTIQAIEKELE